MSNHADITNTPHMNNNEASIRLNSLRENSKMSQIENLFDRIQ